MVWCGCLKLNNECKYQEMQLQIFYNRLVFVLRVVLPFELEGQRHIQYTDVPECCPTVSLVSGKSPNLNTAVPSRTSVRDMSQAPSPPPHPRIWKLQIWMNTRGPVGLFLSHFPIAKEIRLEKRLLTTVRQAKQPHSPPSFQHPVFPYFQYGCPRCFMTHFKLLETNWWVPTHS